VKRLWPISVYYVGSNIKGHSATDVLVITEIAIFQTQALMLPASQPALLFNLFRAVDEIHRFYTLFLLYLKI